MWRTSSSFEAIHETTGQRHVYTFDLFLIAPVHPGKMNDNIAILHKIINQFFIPEARPVGDNDAQVFFDQQTTPQMPANQPARSRNTDSPPTHSRNHLPGSAWQLCPDLRKTQEHLPQLIPVELLRIM